MFFLLLYFWIVSLMQNDLTKKSHFVVMWKFWSEPVGLANKRQYLLSDLAPKCPQIHYALYIGISIFCLKCSRLTSQLSPAYHCHNHYTYLLLPWLPLLSRYHTCHCNTLLLLLQQLLQLLLSLLIVIVSCCYQKSYVLLTSNDIVNTRATFSNSFSDTS